MTGNNTPPGDTPPPLLTKGPPGFELINDYLGWLTAMSIIPEDASLIWTPGTPTSPGRLRATASGSATSAVTPPFTVVSAAAKDKDGTPHPGRVRIYNGRLNGYLPAEMFVPDLVLPTGTDNHCYLTMGSGVNYIYAKLGVDGTSGLYIGANIYTVTSEEEADGTYVYVLIATVNYDTSSGSLNIGQETSGNQDFAIFSSADGSIIQRAS